MRDPPEETSSDGRLGEENGRPLDGNNAISLVGSESEMNGKKVVGDVEKTADIDQDVVIEKEEESPAPDGGYAWMIVLACFLVNLIAGGLVRSAGILYLEFQARFGTGAQLTAWPDTLASTINFFLGPVGSACMNRFSVRTTVMMGTFLFCTGLVLTAFAPNIGYLFFSFSILQGVGRTLLFGPSITSVNMYFDKRRGLASGVAMAGIGVGSFTIVPLLQFLFDFYGYTGTFLMITGISSNMFVAALLFRQPRMRHRYMTTNNRFQDTKEVTNDELLGKEGEEELVPFTMKPIEQYDTSIHTSNERLPQQGGATGRPSGLCERTRKNDWIKPNCNICFPCAKTRTRSRSEANGVRKNKSRIFHTELCKNIPFLILCFSNMFFILAFKSAFTFLPAIAVSRGLTQNEAALVITIAGVLDTSCRIASGFVMDWSRLRHIRPILYTSLLFLMGAVSLIIPSLESLLAYCIVCALYGILTGSFFSQRTTVLADLVGKELVGDSFGMIKFFQGFGVIVGPIVSGALKDTLDDYSYSFYLGGAAMIAGGCLMLLSNFLILMKKSRPSEGEQSQPVYIS